MRIFLLVLTLAAGLQLNAQYTLSGRVTNNSGEPLAGAVVRLAGTYHGTQTNSQGHYEFKNLKDADALVEVSLIGFSSQQKRVDLSKVSVLDWVLTEKPFLADEVVITATRAADNSPIAHTTMDKKEIEQQNLGQDLPMLLNSQPSVVVSSDAGNGIGYTGIRVRGSDPTRINITVNGIPMNDAESQLVYWVNMPDFASSVSNIQLQRGVGTSTNGAGAFGATLNLQTNEFRGSPYASLNTSAGSFHTLRNTLQAGTGLIKGFTLDMRLSKLQSEGYIERASSDLKSFYLSGAYYRGKTNFRANIFSGIEHTYQAWYGVSEDMMQENRRFNPAGMYTDENGAVKFYENQTDNYQQDHYQFFVNHEFSSKLLLNAAVHYTRGRGYYEEYKEDQKLSSYNREPLYFGEKQLIIPVDSLTSDTLTVASDTVTTSDLIRQRWLDNHFYGTVISLKYSPNNRLSIIAGGGWNQYRGDHFGEVIWAGYGLAFPRNYRYYDNSSVKTDYNIYLKANYDLGRGINLFADMQYRQVDYSFLGYNFELKNVQQEVRMPFFNPKGGITWDLNAAHRFFLSHGVAHREPARDDFTNSSPESRPDAEQLQDTEFGYRFKSRKFQAGLTTYYMNYHNQLVLTGAINDVGEYTRVNAGKSYRSGLEFELGWKPVSRLRFTGNATLSRNKIANFSEFVYDYATDSEEETKYTDTDISFSPSVIGSGAIEWIIYQDFSLSLNAKYVGKQYLDNTSSDARKLDAFFTNDLRINFRPELPKVPSLEFAFVVYNLFDVKYAPNGYTYSDSFAGQRSDYNYYYPQAGRNFMGMLKLSF